MKELCAIIIIHAKKSDFLRRKKFEKLFRFSLF